MEKMLWIVIGILISLLVIHYTVDYLNTEKTSRYIKSFPYDIAINEFPQAASRFYAGKQKPFKRAVLLLHGYSASPQEFTTLYQALEKAGIPYYAPRLLGFGLGNMDLLRKVTHQDFLRNALNAYDILEALSEEVDVVGHSNGGTLAMLISQYRPVNKIILSSPYLAVPNQDLIYKKWLEQPILGWIMRFLVPVFPKPVKPGNESTGRDTLDQAAAKEMFHYPALPSQSLLAIWKLQDQLNIPDSNAKAVYLIYGARDPSFPLQSILALLETGKFSLQVSALQNSSHNIFEDYEAQQAVEDVMQFLQMHQET